MAVQKAYDTLTDVTKRRAYDSSLEFDDSIPGKSRHVSVLEANDRRARVV